MRGRRARPFRQSPRRSLALVILLALQIALVISMLAISSWTGNPIRFD